MNSAYEAHYILVSQEKFDDYLKAVGVGFLRRKLAVWVSAHVFIYKGHEDEYHLTSISNFSEMIFKLGEPFRGKSIDGRDVEITFALGLGEKGENVLMETEKDIKTQLQTTADYVFQHDKVTVFHKCNGVTGVHTYIKAKPTVRKMESDYPPLMDIPKSVEAQFERWLAKRSVKESNCQKFPV